MLKDRASAQATAAYASRFGQFPGNYRTMNGLSASSIGIGTYLGDEVAAKDSDYESAIRAAVLGGINLVDTAINYRFQRSERVIGRVIGSLTASRQISRGELIVATKGGYIAFDGQMPADPSVWFESNYVSTGIVKPADLVQGSHCMTPRYLAVMLETSRANLGLETIDIYYVHNPETQLAAVSRDEFHARIRAAFEFLEESANSGKIGCYGAATWNGFRAAPNDRAYLSLAELVQSAKDVAGASHHFKVIQLPYNLAMSEALTSHNQKLPGHSENVSLLAAADALGISVCASAALLQGQLTRRLPEVLHGAFPEMTSDAQRAIQFVRSTPGINVALVGMSSTEHLAENLATAKHPPANFDALMKLFRRAE
jgi:aryl-alcohol dehydrogenase-like predicted oxidoreductase